MTQTAEQIRPTAPQLGASSTYVNTTSAAPGTASRTAWAGVGNGVLVFNAEGATSVASMSARDYQFTQWDPTAATDLQALLDVFDTNHDGRISAGDANFDKFMVAVTNADGTSTLASLASLGITAINLTQNAETTRLADGSSIDGTLTYTRADGSTGQAATVTFANDNANAVIQTTTTRNADGSTTLTTTTYLPDGTRSGALTTTTSAPDAFGGSTRTLATDSTGNGIIDHVETIQTTIAADGSRSETRATYLGAVAARAGALDTRTTTITSAVGRTITTAIDATGGGFVTNLTTDATAPTGSRTVTQSILHKDGSLAQRTVTATSADGLTQTISTDPTGAGVFQSIVTNATVVAANGTRTETVTATSANGALINWQQTTTSVDGRTKTTSVNRTGLKAASGVPIVDAMSTATITTAANGSTLTTQQTYNGAGTVLLAARRKPIVQAHNEPLAMAA